MNKSVSFQTSSARRNAVAAAAAAAAWCCLIPAFALSAVTDHTAWGAVVLALLAVAVVLISVSMILTWNRGIEPAASPSPVSSGDAVLTEPSLVELLLTMHHELRTPLNAVVGAAELLERPTSPAAAELVGVIQQGAETALALVNDVLELSRLEARGVGVNVHPVAVRQVVADAVSLLGPTAAAANVVLNRDVSGVGDIEVLADERQLKQVLINLIANAVKFTSAYGSVTVKVREIASAGENGDPDSVRLEFAVSDTGIGLSPDEVARLFRPYDQSGPGSGGKHGGSGLGLMISRRIVEGMGGRLGVTSRQGAGSTFYFSVLVSRAPIELDAPVRPLSGRRALYLGRSAEIGAAVAGALDGLGFTTRSLDPAEVGSGVRKGLGQSLDLIVVEHGNDGLDGCAALASVIDQAVSKIPVVVVSRPDEPECAAGNVDAVTRITFPIRAEIMRARLERVLQPAGQPQSHPAEAVGDFEGLRVLVAEDDEINSRVLTLALRRFGIEPEVLPDGVKAVAAATPGSFDLLLLDHDLPGLSGPQVARAIRASQAMSPAGSRGLIVGLSAWNAEEQRRACLDAGMDHYLVKPINRSQLQALLEEVGWRTGPSADAPLPAPDGDPVPQ